MNNISNAIRYVGVNDHQVDLFEGQYPVPNGMSYNSYVILDEKVAVLDTVDIHFTEEWLANLAAVLNGRKPDTTWSRTTAPASPPSWPLTRKPPLWPPPRPWP